MCQELDNIFLSTFTSTEAILCATLHEGDPFHPGEPQQIHGH